MKEAGRQEAGERQGTWVHHPAAQEINAGLQSRSSDSLIPTEESFAQILISKWES